MAGSSREFKPPELTKLEISAAGLFYVEDPDYAMYEIEAFLGDDSSIFQVFKAKYSPARIFDDQYGRRRKGDARGVVALKLARIDDSDEFKNMKNEVENSFKIGQIEDQENNVISANRIIVGIYKCFNYRKLFCVSMPYMDGGSLRYIINKRIYSWKLPEEFIAVVLREVLIGLCFLHRSGKVHKKLNAGNIFFLGNFHDPQGRVTVKLGYEGSTYFHNPEVDISSRIWNVSWNPGLNLPSNLQVNRFWTIRGIYEPSSREEENCTDKSDIWNLGVTALELAFGPILKNVSTIEDLRTTNEFRTFLRKLRDNKRMRLPRLPELFFPEPGSRIAKKSSIASRSIATAEKVRKGFNIAGNKVKVFMKKVKVKLLLQKSKPDLQESSRRVQLSNSFTAMVKKCLAFDPAERPTAEELLADPFFQEHQNAGLQDFRNFVINCRPIPPVRNYFS